MNIKLRKKDNKPLKRSEDIYKVMQRVLLRENYVDRKREHLWTISLDNALKILNIELVSLGTADKTLVEPMEVFSVPLQKKATQIILIHNHPSGELEPSEADKDLTDRLIQSGIILKTPVLDHLIINEEDYYTFAGDGLLAELEESTKYVPPYMMERRLKEQAEEKLKEGEQKGEKRKAIEMAKCMKSKGYIIKEIAELTGLTASEIKALD